jgi:dihydrofolate reductase
MNVTLDGFMAGPNYELDWHFQSWTTEMAELQTEQLGKADTILLGGVTYSAMAKYWPAVSADLSFPREDIAFADMMNSYSKVVFSKTITAPLWNNSRVVKGQLRHEILKLKQEDGKNIIIYGSGKLVSSLIGSGLIDEYVLWMHPVVLGKGKPLFTHVANKLDLQLVKLRQVRSGVVILHYNCLSGSVNQNVDPLPSTLSTLMRL